MKESLDWLERLTAALADRYRVERFLREVKIAANLQHPHVLPLYDSGQAEGFLHYVMPYVEGTPPSPTGSSGWPVPPGRSWQPAGSQPASAGLTRKTEAPGRTQALRRSAGGDSLQGALRASDSQT